MQIKKSELMSYVYRFLLNYYICHREVQKKAYAKFQSITINLDKSIQNLEVALEKLNKNKELDLMNISGITGGIIYSAIDVVNQFIATNERFGEELTDRMAGVRFIVLIEPVDEERANITIKVIENANATSDREKTKKFINTALKKMKKLGFEV